MIEIHGIPAFADNYIWQLRRADTAAVAFVDPGDARPVIEAIERDRLQPCALLITHHHRDHTGGIAALVERYPMPVYGPAREGIRGVDHPVAEGDQVVLAELGLTLTVMETPGHTRGHVCYRGDAMLFCGDTLFTAGCGGLFEGTPAQMFDSLQRIAALDDETRIYCAHEYTLDNLRFALTAEPESDAIKQRIAATTAARAVGKPTVPSRLAEERQTNPFLRSGEPTLRRAAEVFAGRPLNTAEAVFATVRHWKDTLD